MSDTTPPQTDADDNQARRTAARKTWLIRFGILVAVVAVAWLIWYLIVGRNYVSTDDAYVNAEMAQVTPQISATAIAVRVSDTQFVKAGTVLVELDPSDAKIDIESATADLATARRKFQQTKATSGALDAQIRARAADIAQAQAGVKAAEANLDKADIDLKRREALAPTGGVSGDELTTARNNHATAVADLAKARATLAQATASRFNAKGTFNANEALVQGFDENTDPGVRAAVAKLDAAKLELSRTVIRAPIDGIVSKRAVQIGQKVTQGTSIMTIVPPVVYVDANFKERQLRRMEPGQPADVTADIYGSAVTYHGHVQGIGGATGSAMAIIPAQNATGNWIKVVQRLPVRIALDPQELKQHPLRVGLSTDVTIDVSAH